MDAVSLNSTLVKMSQCQMIELSLVPIHDIYTILSTARVTRNSLIMLLYATLQKHEAVSDFLYYIFYSDSFSP